mmetsp:Transcript_10573/g.20029  ORF Transcript_10573/g.20029 Transcript_10573/m.20029 type:complete len:129 (+) Transcript_10573:252-638(+)
MGSVEEGLRFADSVGLDLNEFPLLLDRAASTSAMDNFQAYQHFGLHTTPNLSSFLQTIDINTVLSASRALLFGHIPSMQSTEGSLARLGGTFLLNPEGEILFSHVDTKTGGHASVPILLKAVRNLQAC